jgi:quinoprotein glucose dehydrogenase
MCPFGARAFGWRGDLPLSATPGLGLLVTAASWLADLHSQGGSLAAAPDTPPLAASGEVAPGEWPAYGRTQSGRRYSPLSQITPGNVDRLQVAWHYHTGDTRGRSGDPVETTFEVTPLRIGNRVFLCTPHQDVDAVDATTGAVLWRHDTHLRDDLALQHMTSRGLAYAADLRAGVGSAPDAARLQAAQAAVPNLPVAAETAATADCAARLFLLTADGRLVAVDPGSGAVCRNFGAGTGQVNLWVSMPNVPPGAYYSTSPPVVADGLVVVGGNQPPDQWGGNRSPSVERFSSSVVALHLGTGEVRWRF